MIDLSKEPGFENLEYSERIREMLDGIAQMPDEQEMLEVEEGPDRD